MLPEDAATIGPVPALRHLRRLKGWTQQELADAAGVALDTISDLERGAREPRPHTMRRIAQALGVRIQDITEFVQERPKDEREDPTPPATG
jgi:transcriptional regulator with XRE-family HTH domain